MFVQPHPNFCGRNRIVYVMSKRSVKESKCSYGESVPNETVLGTIGRNEMDTHTDTCCAGANWRLLNFTNEVCEVTPFLDLYEPVKEVMVARCSTIWMSPNTGHE
jgi:hypothetical protein